MQKDRITLTDRDPHKGLHIALPSDDIDKIEMFKGLCYLNLPRRLGWFHQCNTRQFQMFEFWTPNWDVITERTRRIAGVLRLPIDIDCHKTYDSNRVIECEEFLDFCPDLHTFDDFN